jgi:hypothetical protein
LVASSLQAVPIAALALPQVLIASSVLARELTPAWALMQARTGASSPQVECIHVRAEQIHAQAVKPAEQDPVVPESLKSANVAQAVLNTPGGSYAAVHDHHY